MRIGRREKRKQWIAGAFGVCAAVVADQLTKELAYRNLKLSGKGFATLIPGVLELRYLENRGAAFGMLQNRLPLFIPGTQGLHGRSDGRSRRKSD